MSTVGRSLGAHDVVQFQSESPFSSDGSLSRAEMEQRDYALAKKLQEEEDRAHCLEERTVNSAETEDGGNIGSLLRSRRQLNPQRQPLPNNDQEVYSDDWSPASPNWEETDNDDSDVSIESRMSEESLISENDWSEAEIPEGSEVESGRDGDEGDEEEFNEEDDMENLRSDTASDGSGGEMATMPPSESDNEVDQSFMSLDETRGSVDMPDDDDYQLDDTVVRSEEFGRCTICFEDIPYDPVGCLYCQQLIGCRRCVNRWYSGGLRMNTSEIYLVGECPPSNHKQCPLCRHEWEDQVEVTSMFNLVFN